MEKNKLIRPFAKEGSGSVFGFSINNTLIARNNVIVFDPIRNINIPSDGMPMGVTITPMGDTSSKTYQSFLKGFLGRSFVIGYTVVIGQFNNLHFPFTVRQYSVMGESREEVAWPEKNLYQAATDTIVIDRSFLMCESTRITLRRIPVNQPIEYRFYPMLEIGTDYEIDYREAHQYSDPGFMYPAMQIIK